jgi:hypothetical protein
LGRKVYSLPPLLSWIGHLHFIAFCYFRPLARKDEINDRLDAVEDLMQNEEVPSFFTLLSFHSSYSFFAFSSVLRR